MTDDELRDFVRRGQRAQDAVNAAMAADEAMPDEIAIDCIHIALMAWLIETFPRSSPVHVITALTYEIGRSAGQLLDQATDDEIDTMLDGIRTVMRDQIDEHRAGRLPR